MNDRVAPALGSWRGGERAEATAHALWAPTLAAARVAAPRSERRWRGPAAALRGATAFLKAETRLQPGGRRAAGARGPGMAGASESPSEASVDATGKTRGSERLRRALH